MDKRNYTLAIIGMLTGMLMAATTQAAELPSYEIVGKGGQLLPDALHVPAGQRFKIVLRNAGNDAVEFESTDLRKEKVLAPGATSFVVIAPLKPGSYRFFDDFHPDTGKGRIIAE